MNFIDVFNEGLNSRVMSGKSLRPMVLVFMGIFACISPVSAGRHLVEFKVLTMNKTDADLVVKNVDGDDHTNLEIGLNRLVEMRRAKLVGEMMFIQNDGGNQKIHPKTTPSASDVELLGEKVPALKILAETSVENGFVELRFEYECTQKNFTGKPHQIQWATTFAPPLERWFVAVRSDLGDESTLCLAKVLSNARDVETTGSYARIDFEVYEVDDRVVKEFADMGDKTMSESYPRLAKVGKKLGGGSIVTEWGGETEIRKYIHSHPFLGKRRIMPFKLDAKKKDQFEDIRCDTPGIGLALWGVYGNSKSSTFYCDADLNYSNPTSKETSAEDRLSILGATSKDYPWQISTSIGNRLVAVRVSRVGGGPTDSQQEEEGISLPIRLVASAFRSSSGMSKKKQYHGLNWVSDQKYYGRSSDLIIHGVKIDTPFVDMFKSRLEIDEGTEMTFDPSTCVLTIKDDPSAMEKVKAFLKANSHRF